MIERIINIAEFFHWLLSDALNITVVTRKWTVSYGDWYSGKFDCFWFKRNADIFAKSRSEIFVGIRNEISGKYLFIRNNPNNEQPPRFRF